MVGKVVIKRSGGFDPNLKTVYDMAKHTQKGETEFIQEVRALPIGKDLPELKIKRAFRFWATRRRNYNGT